MCPSQQPLGKGEILVRFEVNTVMQGPRAPITSTPSRNVVEVLRGLGEGGEHCSRQQRISTLHFSPAVATDSRLPQKGVLLAARCFAEATCEGLPSKLGSTPPRMESTSAATSHRVVWFRPHAESQHVHPSTDSTYCGRLPTKLAGTLRRKIIVTRKCPVNDI